jgi:hypothetical protein
MTKKEKQQAKMRKIIRDRERRFHKMSRAQQRVVVAKDVLALIQSKKYAPAHKGYLVGKVVDIGVDLAQSQRAGTSEEVRDLYIEAGAPRCTGCALGSVLLACVLRTDELTTSDLFSGGGVNTGNMVEYLEKYFSFKQLALIEKAFEGSGVSGIDDMDEYQSEGLIAAAFGAQFKSPTARVIAIMKNIIANDGMFVPPPLTDDQEYKAMDGRYAHFNPSVRR